MNISKSFLRNQFILFFSFVLNGFFSHESYIRGNREIVDDKNSNLD